MIYGTAAQFLTCASVFGEPRLTMRRDFQGKHSGIGAVTIFVSPARKYFGVSTAF
jgi:hypothetical protein